MIKKLRIKLIAAAMLSLIAVLAVVIGAAGAVSYHSITSEADSKLQLIANSGGNLPGLDDVPVLPEQDENGNQANDNENHLHKNDDIQIDPDFSKNNSFNSMRSFSPEMPYELRYFSVTYSASENSEAVIDVGRIAAVDEAQALSYAEQALESGSDSGYLSVYRFIISTDSEGNTQICFLDCYRDLHSFQRFIGISILISLAGSVAVLLLLILTSGRIIKPVAEAYEKQKRFITDAGHELKTPLTIISADTEVLEMDHGKSEWIDDIRSQTTRLADLTNSLVYLARMEEQPQLENSEFSFSDAALDTVADFEALAKSRNKQLSSSVEPDLTMRGDEKTIRRLMTIFLDNAMKYSDDHGTIRLSLDKWRGQLRLQVYNTADHIERENLSHLFDRFYRTDSSRNSETGGYGLGLSIAAAIVSSHHGKISASTGDEKSLLITVLFP